MRSTNPEFDLDVEYDRLVAKFGLGGDAPLPEHTNTKGARATMETTPNTIDRLTAASHRALAGSDPRDTLASYGLTLEDAATFAAAWTDELAERATELGEDPSGREFTIRVGVGLLAIGIEFERSGKRERDATSGGGGG